MHNNSTTAAAAAHNEELRTARDLTNRIAANDTRAEAEAYVRYDKKLRGSVARYARCEADIDDWVSIAWLTALPKLRAGYLDKPESLGGFLMSVARRVTLGELRKCKWLSTSGDSAFLDQAMADEDTPFDATLRAQLVDQTTDLIGDLPVERDKHVIVARLINERSNDSVCSELGLTKAQLARVMYRAKQRLRERALLCEDSFLVG